MSGVVGGGAGNSQSRVGADGGVTGDGRIWLCVATSRLDLSSSPPTGEERRDGKEGFPLVLPLPAPLRPGTTLKETENAV